MKERVPMLDLGPQIERLWPELERAAAEVLRSGRYILGPQVEAFERECARWLGAEHAVGLNSGTDALILALRTLELRPRDEVLTPAFTYFATAEAIEHAGGTPVFVDIDPHSFCMDAGAARAAVTPRTRAMLPVHLYGHPAEMDALRELADEHGLAIVEDVAQGMGARYRGRALGTLGLAGAFSFFPSKTLGAFGDGGLLVSDDAALVERVRALRMHGSLRRGEHVVLGYNSRLDELQAALLRVKLRHLEGWIEGRRRVAGAYDEALAGIPGLCTPRASPHVQHAYCLYTVRVPEERRSAIIEALAARGIASAVHYERPLHQLPLYAEMKASLPETDRASREVLSLPLWPELELELVREIAAIVRQTL